ncbi:hypothetical protein M9Y10_003512 [Tritrichomonas musculus]|uniref:Protein kinase domain-containing protein n=1 Tax=Tritrichomonas musculus TaxID=1915356 RepID=A0ABR2JSG8_9EUKA
MIKTCGHNEYSQLCENSNNKNAGGGDTAVYPPCNFEVDISSVLSLSFYGCETAWVAKERAYCIGYNDNNQILESLPQEVFKTQKEITYHNDKDERYQFMSAVCGNYYTLYHISLDRNFKHSQLLYSYYKHSNPIIVNINGHQPISLYGGNKVSAVIDTEGFIFVITETAFENPTEPISATILPNKEKAVSVACCDDFLIALGSSGRVFEGSLTSYRGNGLKMTIVRELFDTEITSIAGTYSHCFAISKDGKVFGRGSNEYGQLGIGEGEELTDEFVEIRSLNKYKIKSASAGFSHSLFLTSEGKVLACGNNYFGQLATSVGPSEEDVYFPVETDIKDGATFCIAGSSLTAIFVGAQPPPNTPNMTVSHSGEPTDSSLVDPKDELIKSLNQEVANLKKKIVLLEMPESKSGTGDPFNIIDTETFHSLRIIRKISSGGSGEVVEVGKEEKFALKMMHVGSTNYKTWKQYLREHERLNMLRHPNIVNTYGIYLGDETTPISILLELCPEDMNSAINNGSISKECVVKYVYEICEGMKFAHFCGIIHRDLKPSNILIDKHGNIKISDFGISKLMTTEEQCTTMGGDTQKFMAPEILNEEQYDEKVDVYAFGVILFFMISGGEMPNITIIQMGTGMKAAIPSSFTPFSKALISKCCEIDPKKRPSFSEILEELERNKYGLFELSETEVRKIRNFVEEHKKRIPDY